MEFAMGLEPCMLCMSQRFVYLGLAFVFMLGALHNPYFGGHKRYGSLLLLLSLAGLGLASRQLYLQSLPADLVPACGPSFSYMVDAFPFTEVLMTMIKGSGSCAEVQWSFLGLSIAGWSFVLFSGLTVYNLRLTLVRTKILLV
ncbi:MAG TPA: disulfide bond formation protein B, partial [Oceanospirillaceae bacterium]|jgi:disulfide bond formation protein DsbB|nr:disulfide bond formation protein B [Oceanospirillaceae bacterium]